MTQHRLPQYIYALDDIAPRYKTITAAVELLYTVSQEAVDDDVVLCRMFQAHFTHIITKDSTIERAGRALRARELKKPASVRRFQRSEDICVENKAQEYANRMYWAHN